MKVFSKAKFIEDGGYNCYLKCKSWVDECDGKIVEGGYVNGYASDRAWEVEADLYTRNILKAAKKNKQK